ncbi:MAG: ABC transporter ATP-binding protein [Bacteroidales bacterium]|jgi:iron complex transport system ATP-binding protein|nr:ABC transporter ATP-binding protein [Bacteroidales bacterium]MDG2082099.1 ABC transporter ATP-binding protein [Bacteroidales bacterium]|tara:strand:+ start:10505 stop:11296 length:792 start_codon:yes stop_codon:yes gene_type:complete
MELENTLLELSGVDTGYTNSSTEIKVLQRNIRCEVKKGEFIALLGPNGVGKSSLIKTITGMVPSLAGNVFIKGKNIRHMSNREIASEIALVLTDKISDTYLTAKDVVLTGRYPYGSFLGKITKMDIDKVIKGFDVVGANNLIDRYFHSLSDGEKQKVLLARAVVQDTPLIILDEPTAFIDSPGKIQIMKLLKELVSKHNKSVIITTHDTDMALKNVSTVWLLGFNKEFYSGSVPSIIDEGLINRVFDVDGVSFNKNSLRFESI